MIRLTLKFLLRIKLGYVTTKHLEGRKVRLFSYYFVKQYEILPTIWENDKFFQNQIIP
jgi:hypothetical protein